MRMSDLGMWGPIGGVLAGLFVVGGVIFMAVRHSGGTYDELRLEVARVNEAMQGVAGSTGLRFEGAAAYEHPVVGTIPAYGRLSGVFRGYTTRVFVESEYNSPSRRDELRVEMEGPGEQSFDPARAAAARTTVAGSKASVEVTPRIVRVSAGEGRAGKSFQSFHFPDESAALAGFLEMAADAADAARR